MADIVDQIGAIIKNENLTARELKGVLRDLVKRYWPDLPGWSTLKAPVIEEVQKATSSSGVVVLFQEKGVRKVILAEAGDHYKKEKTVDPSYMLPGGFANLTCTEGSSFVAASKSPEDAFKAAAREVEEEFRRRNGRPLFRVDPARLELMDTQTLSFPRGEKCIVHGLMLRLTAKEVTAAKRYAAKLARDPAYKQAAMEHTVNKSSKKPEVSDVKIFTLDEIVGGKVALLHSEQASLFRKVSAYFCEPG